MLKIGLSLEESTVKRAMLDCVPAHTRFLFSRLPLSTTLAAHRHGFAQTQRTPFFPYNCSYTPWRALLAWLTAASNSVARSTSSGFQSCVVKQTMLCEHNHHQRFLEMVMKTKSEILIEMLIVSKISQTISATRLIV